MINNNFSQLFILLIGLSITTQANATFSWDGSIELEHRYFWQTDTSAQQTASLKPLSSHQTSIKLEAEFYEDWNNGNDSLVFEPLIRLDSQDNERSHADIRQLIWTHYGKNWEFSGGIGRVFWGVTESQHLVDIINQTDGVENIDGEDKLGQPMLRYQYFSDLGNVDVYLLPYFRTRTFAGRNNRLNAGITVNNDTEEFASNREQRHLDYAARYSNTLGSWSIGLSWFEGTSREPDIFRLFAEDTLTSTPFYPQINQLGADIQVTTDAWLIKLEAIKRNFDDNFYQDYSAVTVGAEYTFVGVFNTAYDLGTLAEYSWDERNEMATGPFQNDAFVGARLSLNDINNSEILLGASLDLDDSTSRSLFLEASTRIASTFTANLEVRYFDSTNPNDLFFNLSNDRFLQIGIEYFFD